MTVNMTEGRPVRLMLRFALPLMLLSLVQQVYTLCDSMIVGRYLGPSAFAATGAAGNLNWFPLHMMLGLIAGFGVSLAQRFGSRDESGYRSYFGGTIVLGVGCGVLFGAVCLCFAVPFFELMNTPPELLPLAMRYARVLWLGFWVCAFMNVFSTALMSVGDSRTLLAGLVLSALVNVVLDVLFITVLNMGVEGAALATVISHATAALWSLRGLLRVRYLMPRRQDFRVKWQVAKQLLRLGIPRLFSNGIITSGELLVMAAVNVHGVAFFTGITAARRYMNLTNVVGSGLDGAVATFVGQNWGAGRVDRIRTGTRWAVCMGLCASTLIALFVVPLAEPMIRLFVPEGDPETIRVGAEALRIQTALIFSLYLLCEYRSAIQGMGNVVIPMFSGFLELALRILCTLGLPLLVGKKGLYFTDVAAWVPTMIMLMVSYYVIMGKLKKAEQAQ